MFRKAAVMSFTAFTLAVILVGVGMLVGFRLRDKRFRRHFLEIEKAETLGDVLGPESGGREAMSWAYLDRAEAIRRMDEISWSVPTVPTPFVGAGPMPGTSGNAAINAQQFRSDVEVVMPKPAGLRRIFLVGGSTAFGTGAPSGDRTIAGYLERRLNGSEDSSNSLQRYQVLTFACPSWASTQERIAVENRLSEMAPDWIVSLTGVNDAHWGHLGKNVLWFRTYQDQSFWTVLDNYYRAFSGEPLLDVEDRLETAVEPPIVAARLGKNLRLATASLPHSARYLTVLQPTLYSLVRPLSQREQGLWKPERDEYFDSCFQAIRTQLPKLSADLPALDFLDLSGIFDELAGQEVFLDSYHFGDRGNRVIAHAIAQALLDLQSVGQDRDGAAGRPDTPSRGAH